MKDETNLGRNIQHLRKMYGETLSELGGSVFLGATAIKNYESGNRDPKPHILTAIAKHYGKTVDELLSSDLSDLGKMDFSVHGLTRFVELWNIQFPLFTSENAENNTSFKKAYTKCRSILDSFSKNEAVMGHVISDCFELYLESIEEADLPEAVANLMWLLFLNWSQLLDQKMITAFSALAFPRKDQPSDAKIIMKAKAELSDEVIQKRRSFIEDFDDLIYELIKSLKSEIEWNDLGDYYLGMKYLLGMVDSGFSQEMNEAVGMQMLLSQVQLGNKYAFRTLETYLSL